MIPHSKNLFLLCGGIDTAVVVSRHGGQENLIALPLLVWEEHGRTHSRGVPGCRRPLRGSSNASAGPITSLMNSWVPRHTADWWLIGITQKRREQVQALGSNRKFHLGRTWTSSTASHASTSGPLYLPGPPSCCPTRSLKYAQLAEDKTGTVDYYGGIMLEFTALFITCQHHLGGKMCII